MFEYKLQEWLKENGFECAIQFGDNFAYDRESNVLQVGCIGYPTVCRWFEQFLYEYGLDYTGIYDPVLALLHELGHSMTLDQFSEKELRLFDFSKFLLEDERMTNSDKMFQYWSIPDEFSANLWEIEFINNCIDRVCDLCDIYYNYWEDFIKERKCA